MTHRDAGQFDCQFIGDSVGSVYRHFSLKYTGEYATQGISQLTLCPHPEYSSPQYASGLRPEYGTGTAEYSTAQYGTYEYSYTQYSTIRTVGIPTYSPYAHTGNLRSHICLNFRPHRESAVYFRLK
jgi:hypothetical protein